MAGDDSSPSDGADAADVGTGDLPLDTVFELLANERRRFAVYALLEPPAGMIAFDDLVDAVAELEAADGRGSGTDERRRSIAADLHHWHLPVLEDVGVVTYDDRSEIVQYHGNPALEAWTERVAADELG